MAQKLTDPIIRKEAAPEKGARTLFDSEVKGFGIRVFAPTKRNPEGARSFFLNYRANGIERRVTIGEFPLHKAAGARNEARELRKRIDAGEDPASDRRKRRDAATVQDLLDRYVQDHLPKKACFGTWRERDERKMLDQIGDSLGRGRKVADIHSADIEKMHQVISQRAPVRANRVLALTSKCFSLTLMLRAGEHEPWRTAAQGNPCKGVARNHEEGRENFFGEAEIAAIADALDLADEKSCADAVRLIMLTGCRPMEAMRARWPQFDAEPGFWIKPSSHTKQRKTHKAPLGAAASALIDALRETRTESPWVFPGRDASKPVTTVKKLWGATRKRASVLLWLNAPDPRVSGLISSLMEQAGRLPSIEEAMAAAAIAKVSLPSSLATARIYDLRHTFASFGAGSGLGLPVIGKLLGHSQARTTQRYTHLADAQMIEAAEGIDKMIAGAVKAAGRRKAKAGG
jgi:integrase